VTRKHSKILATAHIRGEGVKKGLARGLRLIEKSSDQGFIFARFSLALLYDSKERSELGIRNEFNSIPLDDVRACVWWLKASNTETLMATPDAPAPLILAKASSCYFYGVGVDRNRLKALMLAKAAKITASAKKLPMAPFDATIDMLFKEMSSDEKQIATKALKQMEVGK
jgi:hypothetical protein